MYICSWGFWHDFELPYGHDSLHIWKAKSVRKIEGINKLSYNIEWGYNCWEFEETHILRLCIDLNFKNIFISSWTFWEDTRRRYCCVWSTIEERVIYNSWLDCLSKPPIDIWESFWVYSWEMGKRWVQATSAHCFFDLQWRT